MKLTKSEIAEWKKYRKPSTTFHKCKVNQFIIFVNNSLEHEQAKFVIAYDLMSKGNKILTECEEIATGLRRDLVDLTNSEIYEIEDSTKKRGKRHPKNINVYWYDLKKFRTYGEEI